MLPLSSDITTIVDLGSGIFGERTPSDAAEIVQQRLSDLTELKQQFESESTTVAMRIEELSQSFDSLSKQLTVENQTSANEVEETNTKTKPKPRRRRRIGDELTLDD